MKMAKQAYTIEFKELVVKRIKDGPGVGMVCKELGLSDGCANHGLFPEVPGSGADASR
jgi:hypothetical protein